MRVSAEDSPRTNATLGSSAHSSGREQYLDKLISFMIIVILLYYHMYFTVLEEYIYIYLDAEKI